MAPYSDRCPECVGPIVAPHSTDADDRQVTARYRCPACRHSWVCRWRVEPVARGVRAGAA